MARRRAPLTDLLNDLTFRLIYDKYRMLSMSAFEWSGLPEGIEERFIERELFDHGKAIFFRDPYMNYMCLQADASAKVNPYGEPVAWWATGVNYHKQYPASKCVIINNNPLRIPTQDFIYFYTGKIGEAERTMDVNVKACKTPYIIACDDKDILTFKRIFSMIDGNTPAIYADKRLNVDAIQVLKTDAKFLGNDLMDYKKSVENELLTFLGFDNMSVDKKERVNVAEATSNNQVTQAFSDLQLVAREKACEEINEMFGLSVSVKRRTEPVEEVKNDVENPLESGQRRNG